MVSLLRTFSIIAYLLIFLQGSMILLPLGLMLITGIFSAEPLMRVLLALADIALFCLLIIPFYKRSRRTTFIEIISYFFLLLPLLNIFTSFSFKWFNYLLFLFPAGFFVVSFPLSIFLAHRKYLQEKQNTAPDQAFRWK
jgi:hypothetical protein